MAEELEVSLVGGARTDLTGLTSGEAAALCLLAGSTPTVSPAARSALRTLVRALPETFRATTPSHPPTPSWWS